jgi:hypothetical protein
MSGQPVNVSTFAILRVLWACAIVRASVRVSNEPSGTRTPASRRTPPPTTLRRSNSSPASPMKINWKETIITGLIAIVAVVFVYPLVRPYAQKLPLVGKYL